MAKDCQRFVVIFIILIITAIFGAYINSRTKHEYSIFTVDTKRRPQDEKIGENIVKNGSFRTRQPSWSKQGVTKYGNGAKIEPSNLNKTGNNAKTSDQRPPPSWSKPEVGESDDLEAMLRDIAVDDVIVMAVISINMAEMAMNFYFSSIVKFNVTNLLYVATDHEVCDYVTDRRRVVAGVPVRCRVFADDDEHVTVTRFGNSGVFARRTNVKPSAAYVILKLGYDVMITDLDIVYLRNPLPHVRRLCELGDCDMAVQMDVHEYNSGFVYARPTPATMDVLNRTVEWSKKIPAVDQECFNNALKDLGNSSAGFPRIVKLDPEEFPTAKYAFPGQSCPSEAYLSKVYIIHGNWLKYHDDKIHRFKDCLLWQYDGENGYYSNPKRRYVTYTTHVHSENMTSALLNLFAIGQMLNRTAILPKVIREDRDYIDNSWRIFKGRIYRHGDFDNATGSNYRFANFLRHKLVPDDVKSSLSDVYCIDVDCRHDNDATILTPRDPERGPTSREIHEWFDGENSSVLRLKPLTKQYNNTRYEKVLSRDLYNVIVYKRINV